MSTRHTRNRPSTTTGGRNRPASPKRPPATSRRGSSARRRRGRSPSSAGGRSSCWWWRWWPASPSSRPAPTAKSPSLSRPMTWVPTVASCWAVRRRRCWSRSTATSGARSAASGNAPSARPCAGWSTRAASASSTIPSPSSAPSRWPPPPPGQRQVLGLPRPAVRRPGPRELRRPDHRPAAGAGPPGRADQPTVPAAGPGRHLRQLGPPGHRPGLPTRRHRHPNGVGQRAAKSTPPSPPRGSWPPPTPPPTPAVREHKRRCPHPVGEMWSKPHPAHACRRARRALPTPSGGPRYADSREAPGRLALCSVTLPLARPKAVAAGGRLAAARPAVLR
jgi:hypothetical protein